MEETWENTGFTVPWCFRQEFKSKRMTCYYFLLLFDIFVGFGVIYTQSIVFIPYVFHMYCIILSASKC